MTHPVEDILERAAASLPGAPTTLLRAEMDYLLNEFFRRSRAWRQKLTGLSTESYQLRLDKYPASGRIIELIGSIQDGDRFITPQPAGILRPIAPGKTPYVYQADSEDPRIINFWPTPSAELTDLQAEVFLTPVANGYRQVPEHICYNNTEALLAGLLGRMMRRPKTPYSNKDLAKEHMSEYRMGVNAARHKANKGTTTAPEPWRYPRFA